MDVVKEDRKLVGVREEDGWRREQPTGEKTRILTNINILCAFSPLGGKTDSE